MLELRLLFIILILTTLNAIHSCKSFNGKLSRDETKINKQNIAICNICRCKKYNTIDCFSEKRNKDLIKKNLQSTKQHIKINSYNFAHFNKKLKCLTIDFDEYDFVLGMNINTLSKLNKLKVLNLNNIKGINQMPNLKSSNNLKELTIQNSNLKFIDSKFCLKKHKLQKIDLQYNNLENVMNIFHKCKSLTLLDLSYNKLKTLNNLFIKGTLLEYLVLDNNYIQNIEVFDLSNMPYLIELSISNNMIKFINENAFENLKSLKKLKLFKNNIYSLPSRSIVYESLLYLDVNENSNLIYFPSVNQFKLLRELNVHYSYHCCAFKELITNDLKQNQNVNSNNELLEIYKTVVAQPLSQQIEFIFDYSEINKTKKKNLNGNNIKSENFNNLKCTPSPGKSFSIFLKE
jgi:hypothetical protein